METEAVRLARGRLGRFGVWLAPAPVLLATPPSVLRAQVTRLETLGYGSVWIGESAGPGKEIVAQLGVLLAATERLVVGSGIAPLAARPPATLQAAAATLAEAYPGRLILGLGLGVTESQTQDGKTPSTGPVARMRAYLKAMDQVAGQCPQPSEPFPRVLAALGPAMLALARDQADGAHPFSVPVEHTALARAALGADKLLIPEQAVILDPDPIQARATARRYISIGSSRSPYRQNWNRLGFDESEFADGGTDRLIDARFAWGNQTDIARRLNEHIDAGADSVLLQILTSDLVSAVDQLEVLAPELHARP